jgi:hypothetical protein
VGCRSKGLNEDRLRIVALALHAFGQPRIAETKYLLAQVARAVGDMMNLKSGAHRWLLQNEIAGPS